MIFRRQPPFAVAACLLVALSSLLAACTPCEDIVCAPCSPFTEEVVVAFDLDSLQGGFRRAEIAGAYAVRYAPPGFAAPIDTVRQARGGADFYRGGIGLRGLPWPRVPATPAPNGFAGYNYRFVLPAAGRGYDISSLEVQSGEGNPRSCCSCPVNVRRRFVLNGTSIVADGNRNNELATLLKR